MSVQKKLTFVKGVEAMECSSLSYTHTSLEDTCRDSDIYGNYLEKVLYELGIQFSPGGSSIVEAEVDTGCTEELQSLLEDDSCGRRHSVGDIGTQHGKCTLHDTQQEVLSSKLELSEGDHDSSTPKIYRKKRVYEIGPLENEEMERKRINAVNAKKNREIKKRQIEDLRQELKTLKHINTQCYKALLKTSGDTAQLHQRVRQLQEQLELTEKKLKNKEKENKDRKERMALIQGHLELIAGGLDDDNKAKKLIEILLQRLPT
ncbi:hypothetical protein OTU49_012784 [Cherax quadricarinatus]|uniref:BZIP domain-containing protein n=1 Tax=Cherax quadricarinatus TaxID=27406 RepID=A0AAW0VWT7_CHEQU